MSGSMSDIPLGVKVPQPPDMLQSALRIGALQSYANQNKLFGAHQAVGEAMRASIGEDGEPDHNKLLGILRNDPRVDPAMLETVGTALTQRAQAQGFNDTQRVGIARVVGGLNSQTDDMQTQANYNAALDDAVKSGFIRPEQAKIARARLALAGDDVGKIRQWASAFQAGTLSNPDVAKGAFPSVFTHPEYDPATKTTVNRQYIQPGPMTGKPATPIAGSAQPVTLTPSERAGQVQTNVGGQPGTVPLGTLVDPYGNPIPQGGAPAAGNPLLGPLPSTDLAGRPNVPGQAGIPSAAPPPPAAPPPAAGPAGFNPTALPPQEAERRKADVEQYTAAQQAVPTQQRAVQTLQTARQALDIAATGPGTENLQRALAFLKVVHVPIGADQATNWAVAHKALLDYARQAGAAASSNEQLRAALGSNASTDIDPTAAMHVVQQEIGRQRQNIAAYQEHGDKTGIGFGKHAADFASNTDPRAFAIDAYSKPEIDAMLKRMGPEERAKFERSLEVAYKHKLITLPGR